MPDSRTSANLLIAQIIFQIISLVCSLLEVGLIIPFWMYQKYTRKLPTFKLGFLISSVNIFLQLTLLSAYYYQQTEGFSMWITTTLAIVIFSILSVISATVMIAVDLHLSFIKKCQHSKVSRIRAFYLPSSFFVPLIISIPTFLIYKVQFITETSTYKIDDISNGVYVIFLSFFIGSGIAYCAVIVTIVAFKLIQSKQQLKKYSDDNLAERALTKTISRLMFYPLLPVFCHLTIVVSIYSSESIIISRLAFIFLSLQGIFNLLLFLLNPVTSKVLRILRPVFFNTLKQTAELYHRPTQTEISSPALIQRPTSPLYHC